MDSYLQHHGVKGMHWGVRRYQNKDGSLTAAGRKHQAKEIKKNWQPSNSVNGKYKGVKVKVDRDGGAHVVEKYKTNSDAQRKGLSDKQKKMLKVGAAVAGTALVAYGTHKLINDPRTIANGKKVVDGMFQANQTIKKSVQSSAEYKIGKAAIQGTKKYGGRALDVLGSDKLGKAVTGVGAMAVTGSLLRTQIKELKNVRSGEGDAFDKSMDAVKKISDVGSSVNSLAKGPMNQAGSYNSGSNKGGNDLLKKTRDLKSVVGEPKGIFGADAEKQYQGLFKKNPTDEQRAIIKAMRKNGYSVDQIESYVYHSDIYTEDLSQVLIHAGELYVKFNY